MGVGTPLPHQPPFPVKLRHPDALHFPRQIMKPVVRHRQTGVVALFTWQNQAKLDTCATAITQGNGTAVGCDNAL